MIDHVGVGKWLSRGFGKSSYAGSNPAAHYNQKSPVKGFFGKSIDFGKSDLHHSTEFMYLKIVAVPCSSVAGIGRWLHL